MFWPPGDNVQRQMPGREVRLYDGLAELGVLTSTAARRRAERQVRSEIGNGVGRRRG